MLIPSANRAAGKDFNFAIVQQKGNAGVRCQTAALEEAAILQKETGIYYSICAMNQKKL